MARLNYYSNFLYYYFIESQYFIIEVKNDF